MSYHLKETIFINLPITKAFRQLWEIVQSADGLQAFNHYFTTLKITKKKQDSFERQIALRIPIKKDTHTVQINIQSIKMIQKVKKNEKERKIQYQITTLLTQDGQHINGQFYHQFQQNTKGQVYLIFVSSAQKGIKCFPQKSQAKIQLIKIKDILQNQFLNGKPSIKSSQIKVCC